LRAEVSGKRSEALGFSGGDINSQLVFAMRDGAFDARDLLFEKGASLLNLLLLDGIQAATPWGR